MAPPNKIKRTEGEAAVIEPVEETSKEVSSIIEEVPRLTADWKPITALGKKVKEGQITDIDTIFNSGMPILEAQIVNHLLPNLEEDLLLVGQAKGKFGGGQRRIFRQTQKKTKEGNKIKFTTVAVVGNHDGYVGVGIGKSGETVPSRDKARRSARLNLIRVRRGSGTWESKSREPTSIPFAVTGRCGSVRITLMPAPKGKGLCVEKECAKILALAGIKDVWSKTEGQTKTKLNLIYALMNALRKLSEMKIQPSDIQNLGIVEGSLCDEPRNEYAEAKTEETEKIMPEKEIQEREEAVVKQQDS